MKWLLVVLAATIVSGLEERVLRTTRRTQTTRGKGSSKSGKGGKGSSKNGLSQAEVIRVRITNLAYQQPFGPFFVMTHTADADPLFVLGQPSSDALARLAEDGDPSFLVQAYSNATGVGFVGSYSQGAPYYAGGPYELPVPYEEDYPLLTVATMAVNTNDCFVAMNGVPVAEALNHAHWGPGYDAGTEWNNEFCSSIPGPACAEINTTNTADGFGEGLVHVHRGFFGVGGDLSAQGFDWRNPMAQFQVLV